MYNARADWLYRWLNLLFSDVLAAVVIFFKLSNNSVDHLTPSKVGRLLPFLLILVFDPDCIFVFLLQVLVPPMEVSSKFCFQIGTARICRRNPRAGSVDSRLFTYIASE